VPGLQGCFGIDFVQTAGGPVVIEINPRLTSSYAGLKAALGINTARWVVAAAVGEPVPALRGHPGRTVTLRLGCDDNA
jgi:predicted ATP-grasp superfamily ATP-dependent carboligase